MIISEKIHEKLFNIFLLLIGVTIIFRITCTWLIFVFAFYNLIFYKRLRQNKNVTVPLLIVSSPFLLEILFFFNNDSLQAGIKSLEKMISLLVLPLFILLSTSKIDYQKLLQRYAIATTLIMVLFFIRFRFVYDYLFFNYYNGVDLWEMGYEFANSIGIHAPALNMHLAFVTICNLYFLFYSFKLNQKFIVKFLWVFTFILSFFFVLIVNTRMALLNAIVGFFIVIVANVQNKTGYYKTRNAIIISIVSFLLLLGLFLSKNTFMTQKYTTNMFSNIDKIGKLDEIDHPEIKVYSALVTRLTIWKTSLDLALKNTPFGVGSSDGKPELFQYYKQTNQQFLAKYEFPIHNQYLDFFLRFGFIGIITILTFMCFIVYLGYKLKSPIVVSFFFLFSMSNITDDYLIRFDGIVFSAFWVAIFASCYLKKKIVITL
jgi:O-antigen ligase